MVGVQRRSLVTLVVTSFVLTLLFSVLAGAAGALQAQEQYGQETPAQEATTPDTTTEDVIDQAAQDAQQSDSQNRDDSFQCVSFLRVVRDDQGNLRRQYLNDDLIVQRFEQCLEGEVLKSTIPDEDLPYTGGVPLLGLAALSLASLVAGASVLRAATRRRR
jgi:hypothetical protein